MMGLADLFTGWRRKRDRKPDIAARAEAILTRYHVGKIQGRMRVDDQLLADMQQHMPAGVAIRIFQDFRARRAHEHPHADGFLLHDIVQAMDDVEHFAKIKKPIQAPAQEEGDYRGMTRRERASAKVLRGEPLTEEEEKAMLGW